MQASDVHRGFGRLQMQERGVQAAQMLHASLPGRGPPWDFASQSNANDHILHSTCGALAAAYRRPRVIAPISRRARRCGRCRTIWIEPCRLARKLRGAMIAKRTPRRSRRRFGGALPGPNREEQLVDQHPWIKSYPVGVRWNAEFATMSVPQILEQSAARWSDRSAIDFMGKKLTYRALDDLA